ncbi:hypothetical protein CDL12_09026 [Handroanthus impetiginosus]|uniref:BHLH domain-containing protein n=1 Tax=Handroanthus impetiginosus TaxID=429701 RepID=A0A2G9HLC3_9LAMI|nr:hypothetical protein CDL12_09026 [Handroanthus impetiginosus]
MLALSPQFCSSGWFLDMEDPIISHEQENLNYLSTGGRTETSDSIELHSPTSKIPPTDGEFASFFDGFHHEGHNDDDNKMVKKLNHNASERDRRKRINNLYSTLRSLLPSDDQSKKLSIPATVSRVLKYIPELQKEVERLIQKKQTLISNISRAEDSSVDLKNHRRKSIQKSSFPAVSATRISDREVIIQSSIPKAEKGSFSEAVINLEEEGFVVMNASCVESFGGSVFCNLHIQAQGSQVIDVEMLKEKVWPLYEKGERVY